MCAIAAMAILGSSISSCDSASNSKKSDKKVVTTDSIDACPPINTSETEITSSKDTVKAIGVDLGLSVLWADRNVGASSPEDYGKHYAWGETTAKEEYSWSSYIYFNDIDNSGFPWKTDGEFDDDCTPEELTYIGEDIAGTTHDVAHLQWGDKWMMPTTQQWNELLENCTWDITTKNGCRGYVVTSKTNNNSIFLPMAGFRCDTTHYCNNEAPFYWSSSYDLYMPNHAWGAYFDFYAETPECIPHIGYWHRYNGCTIRPVCHK